MIKLSKLMGKGKPHKPKEATPNVLRLLDANLNRAREGLRVLEDTARFVWRDSLLYHAFRNSRHALARITKTAYPQLISARDTKTDAGRKMLEEKRTELKDLVRANLRRSQEALRVLEEYGKIFSNGSQAKFKSLRFQIYELEKKVLRKHNENYSKN